MGIRKDMNRAQKSALFLALLLPAFALALFLNHKLITRLPWERPHLFFLTFGLFLVTLICGSLLEDRYFWKGVFTNGEKPGTGRNAPMTAPISLGLSIGILFSLKLS